MTFLSQLTWRNATKDFDPDKNVSAEDLAKIKDSIRMAPTSFGLQPYHVVVVTDADTRKQIREHAWGQAQITDSSHLLVFCTRLDISEKRIDQLIAMMSGGNPAAKEALAAYEGMMRNMLGTRSEAEIKAWGDRQTYIALGFAMAACAELQVDSCPIEGFVPEEVDKILKLPPHLRSVVMLPIGYRQGEPTRVKVRFGEDDLFS